MELMSSNTVSKTKTEEISLERARNSHFEFFYRLRCEEKNILWTSHKYAPEYGHLKKWFCDVIEQEAKREIYIIRGGRIPLGYLYCDPVEEDLFELAVAVSQRHEGRGRASEALTRFINQKRYLRPQATFRAWVSDENLGSVKAFVKSGFVKTARFQADFFKGFDREMRMFQFVNYPPEQKVFIIAEAGVNHNGSLTLAKQMVRAAKKAGADAVKFQTFKAANEISRYAVKADYQREAGPQNESQLDMARKLELDAGAHRALIKVCRDVGIDFFSSPFDLESIDLLEKLRLRVLKIPSGEITNLPYLKKIGALKRKIILSTGMANLTEIGDALDLLVSSGTPLEWITVLHCNTEYPTPYEDVNLRAMKTIRETFGVRVGYSDHTPGIEVPVAAVALGASIIEKHFTLDRTMAGPDHRSSLEPGEFKEMVRLVRNTERALGDGIKRPSPSETKNLPIVRKSIVAARDIQKGEIFADTNLMAKRPGTGISPMAWDRVTGKKAKRSFLEDEAVEL
jgi:N,N'-diacetyllegionaminate synthase